MEKVKIFSNEVKVDTVTDSRALGYAGQRKVVADSKGNTYVGYRKDYQSNAEIFVAKVSQGMNGLQVEDTDKPIAVIDKNDEQRVPSLAVDSKDTIHAVWYGSDTENVKNNRQIKYTRRISGSKKWESWRNIAYVGGYSNDDFWQEHPMLLVGQDNTLYVAWEGKDEQNIKQQIKFTRSDNGGNVWSSWKNIEPAKSTTQSRPTMVEDGKGNLYLFMYSSEGSEADLQQVQYAVSQDKGDTWSVWQPISDPNYDSRHISATVDPTGKVYVAWRAKVTQDGPTQIIYRTIANGKLSDSSVVTVSSNYQFFPSIGITDSGTVYVSWMENVDASEFPRENPAGGSGLVSFMQDGKFQTPESLSTQSGVLYPNVSEKTKDENLVPVLYAEQQNANQFNIKLKFLDSSK